MPNPVVELGLSTPQMAGQPTANTYKTPSTGRLLEAIALLPEPIRTTETLHLASKLVEQAAYDLVKINPSETVLPLFTIAAQLEHEAKMILSKAS